MENLIEQLQTFGFSKYEAQAYIALLQRNPQNGYELAKASNIPRPNIYTVLQKLEERGAIIRVDASGATRFTPVVPAELIERLRSRYERALEAASRSLVEISTPGEYETIGNMRTYSVLITHAQSLMEAVKKELILAVGPQEAAVLSEAIQRAEARGVKITTLCLAECRQECGGCRGNIFRYPTAPEQHERWLILVRDGEELLAGEIRDEVDTHAVRTRQQLMVDMAAWYIRHSIVLSALLQNAGDQIQGKLSVELRALLASIWKAESRSGWQSQVNQLLNGENSTQ